MLLAKILLRGLRVSVAAVALLGQTACLAALRDEWKRLRAGYDVDLCCLPVPTLSELISSIHRAFLD